jgi:hypothetical protein
MEKTELKLMIGLLPVADQFKLTGTQVVGMIEALATYMRESKRTDDEGGMAGAVRGMLGHSTLDVPPMWQLLQANLGITRYRENVARDLEDLVRRFAKVQAPGQQSYRELLAAALDAEVADKAEAKKAIKAMKAKWNQDEADEDTDTEDDE